MSLLSMKRSWDSIGEQTGQAKSQCSPHRIEFLQSPTPKRYRHHMSALLASCHSNSKKPPSPFVPSSRRDVEGVVARWESKRKRRKGVSGICQTSPRNASMPDKVMGTGEPSDTEKDNKDKSFTREQVKAIVREALILREQQISNEFNDKLQSLLQEQFDTFTRFQQDYVARRLNRNDNTSSYIS